MPTIYLLFVCSYECKDTKDILKTLGFHCYIKDYCRNLLAFTKSELLFYKLELILLIEFACECIVGGNMLHDIITFICSDSPQVMYP